MDWEKELKHVAKLARIALTEEQVKKLSSQLARVFEYMDILKEADVSKVKETAQVTGLENVMEEDEILAGQASREELLEASELPKDSKQVRVDRVVK